MKKWIVLELSAALLFLLAAYSVVNGGGGAAAASNLSGGNGTEMSESFFSQNESTDDENNASEQAVIAEALSDEEPSVQESGTLDETSSFSDGSSGSRSFLDAYGVIIPEQILDGAEGAIHYSYYLPGNYDESKSYPMMVAMPGRDMMWSEDKSAGTNIGWRGFLAWTKLDEDMIVVSAQLTDWEEKSARQAVELTEYFIENFPVDSSRVYASGYSAGGHTMSRAVAMRPDLYAAYLHCASRWCGALEPVVENKVAVYIFMAEGDEAYGSQQARDDYKALLEAYQNLGLAQEQIDEILHVEIPGNEYFNSRGIYKYHGGVSILFEDKSILRWVMEKHKI